MGIMSSLVDGVDDIFIWLGSQLKQNIFDYCDLETAENTIALVTQDGSYASLIKVNGIKNLIGPSNFVEGMVNPINTALQTYFDSGAHSIQFWFMMDPTRTKFEIGKILESARQTSKRLGLNMDDMLDERVDNLAKYTCHEECYIVLWTTPTVLSKTDLKFENQKKRDGNMKLQVDTTRGQNPNTSYQSILDRHMSFVHSIESDFHSVGIVCEIFDVYKMCREIRKSVDPDFTDDKWRASLIGDEIEPYMKKYSAIKDEWDIVWPKLSYQVCPRDAVVKDRNIVEIGDRIYSPIYIDLFQRELQMFSSLFGRVIERGIPWRMSFLIEGNGLNAVTYRKLFTSILSFTSSDNKLFNRAHDFLSERQKNGSTIVKIRACLTTWADKGQVNLLTKRASDLARAVEGWGSCQVSEVTGDPVAGVMSSALGVARSSIGTMTVAPLDDILCMLPLTRPTSPWESGAVLFRSPDGKLMPYQPGSSKQTTWISLIFAKPGSGKSVLMNMTNMALCLSPGIERLPRIAIIDIGPSSSGLISLIKEALPQERKHEAAYYRVRMTSDYCVNPFDTQLGCRFPSALEKTFLTNFLTLLVTDINSDKPYDAMSGLVAAVIDEMYKKASDKQQPHQYAANIDYKVDEAIQKTMMKVDKKTTWWEVVDWLFERGYYHEAMLAQRNAVPVLAEAPSAAQDEKIRAIYGEVIVKETSEKLTTAFNRMVSTALQYYPILARPTVFDIGAARVVSLDLDEVAKTGGVQADRQTSVMYMLARYILAKDFYVTEETINEIPAPPHFELPSSVPVEAYRMYHKDKIKTIREDLKRICYDEFHRTSKAQTVRDQVLVDMREGRKWAVDVTLSSQALEDFDGTMMEFATGIFIMDGGTSQTVAKIATAFGIQDPMERVALQNHVHGPQPGKGGTFLAKFSTNMGGWYTMLLTSTIGPIELWAFSTTAEDVAIRNRMYKEMNPGKVRRILALKYPGGSAKKDVERRKEEMRIQTGQISEDSTNVLDQIVKELLDYGNKNDI